jgi:sec-independent protein translocase protein TatB
MFDIGFSEIVVIAVVALIVIGPEKLPKVARTLGHMFGRLQRYVNEVKADISREMELEELRKLQSTVQDAARDIEQSMTSAARDVESGVRSVETQLNEAAGATPAKDEGATPAKDEPPSQPSPAGGGSKYETTAAESKTPAAEGAAGGASRQATLPGFERI